MSLAKGSRRTGDTFNRLPLAIGRTPVASEDVVSVMDVARNFILRIKWIQQPLCLDALLESSGLGAGNILGFGQVPEGGSELGSGSDSTSCLRNLLPTVPALAPSMSLFKSDPE